jgi:hypothetical protein
VSAFETISTRNQFLVPFTFTKLCAWAFTMAHPLTQGRTTGSGFASTPMEIKVFEFCFKQGAVDWLWWPNRVTKRRGRQGQIRISILKIDDEDEIQLTMGDQEYVFFDAGIVIETSDIQKYLIECLERSKSSATWTRDVVFTVNTELPFKER